MNMLLINVTTNEVGFSLQMRRNLTRPLITSWHAQRGLRRSVMCFISGQSLKVGPFSENKVHTIINWEESIYSKQTNNPRDEVNAKWKHYRWTTYVNMSVVIQVNSIEQAKLFWTRADNTRNELCFNGKFSDTFLRSSFSLSIKIQLGLLNILKANYTLNRFFDDKSTDIWLGYRQLDLVRWVNWLNVSILQSTFRSKWFITFFARC